MTETAENGALDVLEQAVGKVADRVVELKKQNKLLSSKLRRLEKETAGASSAADEAVANERRELKRRVEGLVATLESLLEGDS